MQSYVFALTFPNTNTKVNFKIHYNNLYGYSNKPSALPDSHDIIYNDGAIFLTSGNPNIVSYSELLVSSNSSGSSGSGPDYGNFTIRFMADTSFLVLYNAEMESTTPDYVPYSDGSIVLFTFSTTNMGTVRELYANSSPIYCVVTGYITVLANICFLGDTIIDTDQGKIQIDALVKNENSIKKNKIVAIAKIISTETNLIEFEKDSIQPNVPSVKTILSPLHKILYKGSMVCAKGVPGGKKIPYEDQFLYNIVLEKYGNIQVNNMTTETLAHSNKISAMFR